MVGVETFEYTKRSLKELLTDEGFWSQPRLPITKRRALSHINNPRADDNDTVLMTAVKKGELVAYIGILPDFLRRDRQAAVKFGWLSTWWVDKGGGNRLAATTLLFSAMKKYSNRIAASSPSSDATRVYVATKRFEQSVSFERTYFILALPPSIRGLSPFVRRIGGAKNRMIFGWWPRRRRLEIRPVSSLNDGLASYINRRAVDDPLARDTSYWTWVMEFPWLSASAEDEAVQERYAFSVFAKDFQQMPVVVTRNGEIIAYLFMTLRQGRLSLKYAYYELCDVADVAAGLRSAIADINPWLFVCADRALTTSLKRGFPFYLATRRKRSEIYAAKGLAFSGGSRPQLGTGDTIFT